MYVAIGTQAFQAPCTSSNGNNSATMAYSVAYMMRKTPLLLLTATLPPLPLSRLSTRSNREVFEMPGRMVVVVVVVHLTKYLKNMLRL